VGKRPSFQVKKFSKTVFLKSTNLPHQKLINEIEFLLNKSNPDTFIFRLYKKRQNKVKSLIKNYINTLE
jgi:hypothetical protein